MWLSMKTNKVHLKGTVVSNFEFNHKNYNQNFYTAKLAVKRLSGQVDTIPIMISDETLDITNNYIGKTLGVTGQFRSHIKNGDTSTNLLLYVFVQKLQFCDNTQDYVDAITDNCELVATIAKTNPLRKTPLGREICEVFALVNRKSGNRDYIPCITWGKTAKIANNFEPGTEIRISGRVQSREYWKKNSNDEIETRTAYEVSVRRLEIYSDLKQA